MSRVYYVKRTCTQKEGTSSTKSFRNHVIKQRRKEGIRERSLKELLLTKIKRG